MNSPFLKLRERVWFVVHTYNVHNRQWQYAADLYFSSQLFIGKRGMDLKSAFAARKA